MLKAGGATGFDAFLLGGLRPGFAYLGTYGYIYTSTESGSNAWRRCFGNTGK